MSNMYYYGFLVVVFQTGSIYVTRVLWYLVGVESSSGFKIVT